MVVVGGRVIQDAITLFTTKAPDTSEQPATNSEPLFDIEFFASLGLYLGVLLIIGILTVSAFMLVRRFKVLNDKTTEFVKWLTKNTRPIRSVISQTTVSITSAILSFIANLLSLTSMLAGTLYAASELGPIRTTCVFLVLISLFATVLLNPGRLLKTAGVVVALVLASLGWDLGLWIVNAVENAPKV